MFKWWLTWRFLSGRQLLHLTSLLAIVGVSVGVAALVVSMAIISGFQTTLKKSVIDVFGDMIVAASIDNSKQMAQAKQEIQKVIDRLNNNQYPGLDVSGSVRLLSTTPYTTVEGIVVHRKKVSGIVLQGLHPATYEEVLNLESRLVEGQMDLSTKKNITGVVIGHTMAKKFHLSVGDVFKIVVPLIKGYEDFQPKVKSVRVTGILTLGRYEYDLRTILIDLKSLQDFVELGDRVSGIRLNIENSDHAIVLSQAIRSQLDDKGYWAMNWKQVNHNLFTAIRYEQTIIFLMLMIIIVAASFNVASTLFISVLKKFRDISILQAMGLTSSTVKSLFIIQGLIIGIVGYILGVVMGLFASRAFIYWNDRYELLNSKIYKLDHLTLNIQFLDLTVIFGTCLGICYLSILGPSAKSKKLSLIEGLKYE